MKRYLLSGIFCLSILCSHAQIAKRFVNSLDEAFHTKPKLAMGFDTRRSFFSNHDVNIFGLRAGINFDNRVRFWLGLHLLSSEVRRNFIVPDPDAPGLMDTINTRLQFGYWSFIPEYVFLRTKRWELSIPVYFGTGRMNYLGLENKTTRKFGVIEPDIQGHFKFFSWIGVGGGAGYRWMLMKDDRMRQVFNNPVYIFKIKLFLGELYKEIFKPEEVDW